MQIGIIRIHADKESNTAWLGSTKSILKQNRVFVHAFVLLRQISEKMLLASSRVSEWHLLSIFSNNKWRFPNDTFRAKRLAQSTRKLKITTCKLFDCRHSSHNGPQNSSSHPAAHACN